MHTTESKLLTCERDRNACLGPRWVDIDQRGADAGQRERRCDCVDASGQEEADRVPPTDACIFQRIRDADDGGGEFRVCPASGDFRLQ